MELSRKYIVHTLGIPVPLNESIQFSKQLESRILYEQILYESFLDSIKNYAKDKFNTTVDTIKDWKDAAVVIGKVLSDGDLLNDFLSPLERRVNKLIQPLADFLKKLKLDKFIDTIKNFIGKIKSLKGWKKFMALIATGSIITFIIEKLKSLTSDGVKDFLLKYFSENFIDNVLGKLTDWSSYLGWLQPIVKGVEIIFNFLKPLIQKFSEAFKSGDKWATKLIKENKIDPITKYLNRIAYKFPKGYPDMNNDQDVLLLETLVSEFLGEEIILENQDLISIIKSNITDYGDLETSGKDTIKLIFSDIPNRGGQSDSMRSDVYDELKALVDKEESLSDYKKLVTGSSLGSAVVNFNGKNYKLIVKGASDAKEGDTDVKEALVSLFYVTTIDSPFTKENYEERVNQLIEIVKNGIPGESSAASQKVEDYLSATADDNKVANVTFINQPLSSALAIKEVYPGQKLIRTGIFDEIRRKAQSITGLPADKWCPGDLYVQLNSVNIPTEDNIELINDLFNDEWGGDSKPLTAISLKQAEAQGGKAKALLNKYTQAKEDYNLTKDEINYSNEEFIQGIEELRNKVQQLVGGNANIKYNISNEDLKNETRFLRGKFAALKSIEFLFRQFNIDEVDEAIVALVGFALSLTGVNPTFFKITGQKSGVPGKVDEFPRGQNVILYNVSGDFEPIEIEDSSTFGGLKIDFKIEKGGEPYSVSINARNNGNTQGTLEVQKIKKL